MNSIISRPGIRLGLLGIAAAAISVVMSVAPASAATDYSNSRMMDDAVFENLGAMTPGNSDPTAAQLAPQIQAFLNGSSVTLANGKVTSLGAASKCLQSYQDQQPSWNGTSWSYGSDVPASTIIAEAAVQWGLNPEVILATLDKEESLVSGTSCDSWRYQSAMGYACPDSGGCSSQYAGFTHQVLWGSWQLKFNEQRSEGKTAWDGDGDITYSGYMTQGTFSRCANTTSCPPISYNGDATIDGQTIYLATGATASLYSYTPHLNQSFPGIFEQWFGSTLAVTTGTIPVTTISQPASTPAVGQTVTYVVSFTNDLDTPITVDAVGIVGRPGSVTSSINRDFGWQGPVTLQPGVAQQFTFSTVVQDTGVIYAWPAISYGGTYIQYNNWGTSMNAHMPKLTLTSPLTSSVPNPIAGQSVTLSATIRNDESQPIQLQATGIPVRFYGTYNYDAGWTAPSSPLQPGASEVISGSSVFDKAGPYTAWVSALVGGRYVTLSPTLSLTTAPVTPSFILTYTDTPDTTPALGENVDVQFTLKNTMPVPITLGAVGVVGRYGSPYSSDNSDFGWTGPVTFTAGQQQSFTSFASNVSQLSNLYTWVAVQYQGSYTQYNKWGFDLTPHLPNLTISTSLSINSGSGPVIGQPATVTVTVKNNESHPINYSAIGIPIRYYGVYSYDTGWQGSGTLATSGQSGDTASLSGTITFDKSGPYTIWASILIDGRYITIGSPTTIHL